MAKTKKQLELEATVAELTADLQRNRADFENYRKRMDIEKSQAIETGKSSTVLKLLPVIDNIERATAHIPTELADNKWAQGVVSLVKSLERSLEGLNLKKIDANPGTVFDPDLHEAVQFDEEAEGETEVISEQMQAGYLLGDTPVRHAIVKVTRK